MVAISPKILGLSVFPLIGGSRSSAKSEPILLLFFLNESSKHAACYRSMCKVRVLSYGDEKSCSMAKFEVFWATRPIYPENDFKTDINQ